MSLFIPPVNRATDANGNVLSGAQMFFYLSGTSTPADVFTTDDRTTAHANPVVANAGGLFAPIYLDPGVSYRVVMKTAAGITVQDIDPFNPDIGTGVTPFSFSAAGNGTTDDMVALQAWLDAGGNLYLPEGEYYCSGRLYVRKNVRITGAGYGFDNRESSYDDMPGSRIRFGAAGGILFQTQAVIDSTATVIANTALYFVQEGSRHSVIENLALIGDGGAASLTAPALLETRTLITSRNVQIIKGRGSGLRVNASAAYATADADYGNASLCVFENVTCLENGLHGALVNGVDSNAIKFDSCNFSSNGAWGVYDTSLLGNEYINCHWAANNTAYANAASSGAFRASSNQNVGSVKATSSVGDHTFTGCYIEFFAGSGFDLPQTCTITGGSMARNGNQNTVAPPQDFGVYSYGKKGRYFHSSGEDTATTPQLRVGHGPTLLGADLVAHAFGADDDRSGQVGGSLDLTLYEDFAWRYVRATGDWDFGPTHYRLSFGTTGKVLRAPKGGSVNARHFALGFDTGLFIGGNFAQFIGRSSDGTTIPDGVYSIGDILLNGAPTAGGKLFKVCTTAGVKASTAWASGAALNTAYTAPFDAIYRTNGGNVYKLTTAPASGNTANAPVHGSGAVTGADGYGWTFMNATTAPAFKDAGAIDA